MEGKDGKQGNLFHMKVCLLNSDFHICVNPDLRPFQSSRPLHLLKHQLLLAGRGASGGYNHVNAVIDRLNFQEFSLPVPQHLPALPFL